LDLINAINLEPA